MKRKLKKNLGIDNPREWLLRPDAMILPVLIPALMAVGGGAFLMGLQFLLYPKFEDVLFIPLMLVYGTISVLFIHYFIFRKKKYSKYFKEFDKKPRKWKIKWALISLGVLLFPFVFFIWSLSMLK